MAELLSYAETRKLLDELDKEHKKLLEDMVPAQISNSGIKGYSESAGGARFDPRPTDHFGRYFGSLRPPAVPSP